jgi:hypothetical protein
MPASMPTTKGVKTVQGTEDRRRRYDWEVIDPIIERCVAAAIANGANQRTVFKQVSEELGEASPAKTTLEDRIRTFFAG